MVWVPFKCIMQKRVHKRMSWMCQAARVMHKSVHTKSGCRFPPHVSLASRRQRSIPGAQNLSGCKHRQSNVTRQFLKRGVAQVAAIDAGSVQDCCWSAQVAAVKEPGDIVDAPILP